MSEKGKEVIDDQSTSEDLSSENEVVLGEGNIEEIEKIIEEHVTAGKRAQAMDDLEDAIDHFSEALQMRVAQHGELSEECAELYFTYGDALLSKCEKNNDIFGGGSGEKQNKEQKDEEDVGDEESQEGDDLEICWNVLDSARVIVSRSSKPDKNQLLSRIHRRLGDLSMLTEQFDQAVTDYACVLQILQQEGDKFRSDIAATHLDLALVFSFQQQNLKVLEHYQKAAGIYEILVREAREEYEHEKTERFKEQLEKRESTHRDIIERINEIRGELMEKEKTTTSSTTTKRTNDNVGVTTIGFGASTSTSTSTEPANLPPMRVVKKPKTDTLENQNQQQ